VIGLRFRRYAIAGVLTLAAAGVLSGCGSGSSGSSAAISSKTAVAGQPSQGGSSTQMAAIQKCLSAAGINMPTPPSGQSGQGGGQPGQNGAQPSGQPTGAPSGMPSAGQSGQPSNGAAAGGQAGGMFSDAKVVAALKACGITVPTNGPGQAGAAPSTSSTN
jgi:ABC-type phosphate transport system substrate-binding protein